ncbi:MULTISPECIES: hypothetical protein [unclassified Burkholderia]|uniref:hypothetical protein n=1 Tax=unclassified Burkholderia TaxID=2613784 RepID=UPI00142334B8|nr:MULTISPECIES: hypothetical protein [unclassified Burkholderia]NIE55608.1 hypothetical protein [Burkholderia sp. Ap-955]NIF10064.1 hypothetical protein [Burkholderia sp. Ax-1735]NIG03417.1 hypothetical protein [Burkholderia sp. Tr-849]
MGKDDLVKLLSASDGAYSEFLRRAKESAKSERWGTGVGAPFSLEPYRTEILGVKPGRMLKSKSEPGPRRYCYSYDDHGRVIHMVAYGKLGGPAGNQDWMRSDDFYVYSENFATRYVFGNTFRENPDSQVTRVVRAIYEDGRISKTFQIERRNAEYTETTYLYDDSGRIFEIRIVWPEGRFPERLLSLEGEGDDVKIFEIRDQRRIPVYPEP